MESSLNYNGIKKIENYTLIRFWKNYTNFLVIFCYKVYIFPDPVSRNLRMHVSKSSGPAKWTDKNRTAADTFICYLLSNKTVFT
jgi:hypothetical protein